MLPFGSQPRKEQLREGRAKCKSAPGCLPGVAVIVHYPPTGGLVSPKQWPLSSLQKSKDRHSAKRPLRPQSKARRKLPIGWCYGLAPDSCLLRGQQESSEQGAKSHLELPKKKLWRVKLQNLI